MKSAFKAF